MRTNLQALGLLLGLGLIGVVTPDTASADTGATRLTPGRPTTQVRQDLREARHRRGVVVAVPELSGGAAAQGIALLFGAALVLSERRRVAAR